LRELGLSTREPAIREASLGSVVSRVAGRDPGGLAARGVSQPADLFELQPVADFVALSLKVIRSSNLADKTKGSLLY
jgi:hypothetical protein